MESIWHEPGEDFSGEQVERGRRLLSRDDMLTSEGLHTRLEVGDLLLEICPPAEGKDETGRGNKILKFASAIGLASGTAREYRAVAELCTQEIRRRVADSGVAVSYTVLREAALGHSMTEDGKAEIGAEQRFEILFSLITEPDRKRITAAEYRASIGARPVPNTVATTSPAKIAEQLQRADVRAEVLSMVLDSQFLAEAFDADPTTESRLRDCMAELRRGGEEDGDRKSRLELPHDDRIRLQVRQRVQWLRKLVSMGPAQIVNVADEETIEELISAHAEASAWVEQITQYRARGKAMA